LKIADAAEKMGVMAEDGIVGGKVLATSQEVGWAAWLLAGVGGWVDAVGFVMLGHLFTANMSGNSVQFAAYFGLGELGRGWPCLLAIPVFMAGIFLGTVMIAWSRAKRPERRVYEVEALLLAGLAAALWVKTGRGEMTNPGVAGTAEVLALLAMGLQNATVRRVGNINLNTTYITNLLQACAQQAARAWLAGCAGNAAAGAVSRKESWLAGRLWVTYAAGALIGAAGVIAGGPWTVLVPAAGLVAVAAGDR
jgi:uncharacterized membrane protein YoaK (UPF0700 family)